MSLRVAKKKETRNEFIDNEEIPSVVRDCTNGSLDGFESREAENWPVGREGC